MLYKRWLVSFTVLSLLLLMVLPACGGGGEETTPTFNATPTATATTNATPTPTRTATPTPTPSGPIKIGAITSWSGTAALSGMHFADPVIKLVEKQLEDMGGILGGRMVRVVKYDNRASVAEAAAGATKLILEAKGSAPVFGGVGGAEAKAV